MRELSTRPWLRAPVLLWRQPGLLLALAAAAFVAVLPAASAPLFLSSARTAALHHQLDNTCAAKVGLHLESRRGFRDAYRPPYQVRLDAATGASEYGARRAAVASAVGSTDGVTAPVTTIYGATAVNVARRGGENRGDLGAPKFWLTGRSDDFAANLDVRQGPSGRG